MAVEDKDAELVAGWQDAYSINSPARRRVLLALAASVYPLLPLADTILLTQMPAIARELGTSSTAITGTMSLYLLAAGAGFALWGPAADWLGRVLVYHAVLGLFLGSSVGCALAPSIAILLAARTVQGFAGSGTWALGNAVVIDVYPSDTRGLAFGIYMMPGMLGPIVAPFIGAALTHAFGWRSMFWFLVLYTAAAQLAVLLVYRETQHHRVARKLQEKLQSQQLPLPDWVAQYSGSSSSSGSSGSGGEEGGKGRSSSNSSSSRSAALEEEEASARHSRKPPSPLELWKLLKQLLTDRTVLPFLMLVSHTFGCSFLVLLQLTELLSTAAGISALNIGLCYLATGCCSMVGSLLGGVGGGQGSSGTSSSSYSAAGVGFTGIAAAGAGRDAGGGLGGATGHPGACCSGCRACGGSAVCFAAAFLSPGGYSYLSQRAMAHAAAVGSLTAAAANIWPAALTQLNPVARSASGSSNGIGIYNSVISGLTVVLAGLCCMICMQQRQHSSSSSRVQLLPGSISDRTSPGSSNGQHEQQQQ